MDVRVDKLKKGEKNIWTTGKKAANVNQSEFETIKHGVNRNNKSIIGLQESEPYVCISTKRLTRMQ